MGRVEKAGTALAMDYAGQRQHDNGHPASRIAVVIITRDRADELFHTLASLGAAVPPASR
jgi:hypothetical protein